MKVYVDDMRDTPDGWTPAISSCEAVELLKNNAVTHISLDHDMGFDGNGNDVLLWIEFNVHMYGYKPPHITIHTSNASAKMKMELGVKSIVKKANDNKRNGTESDVWNGHPGPEAYREHIVQGTWFSWYEEAAKES